MIRYVQLAVVAGSPFAVWPMPKTIVMGSNLASVSPKFEFTSVGGPAELTEMMQRYQKQIANSEWKPIVPTFEAKGSPEWELKYIVIQVDSKVVDLDDSVDESYTLLIKESIGHIKAETIYGARHAMETLYQLVQFRNGQRLIDKVPLEVNDEPKFKHRGLLLDTSRNYFPVKDILRTIETMGRNKLNVFHWHIVDSHSWPFQSKKHPLLSQKGAIFPDQVYTFDDIKEIVAFGRSHGVRIVPELEAPAHSYAFGLAYPELRTCMDMDRWDQFAAEPPSGQIDPTNPKSIQILKDVIDEFSKLFPDSHIHLSGDEINENCWNADPKIKAYLYNEKMNVDMLLTNFSSRIHSRAIEHKKEIIVWEEMVLNHNITLPKSTIVQVWNQKDRTRDIIDKGYNVILSNVQHWYLDCGRGGWMGNNPNGNSWCDPYKHWQRVYSLNLFDSLNTNQRKRVVGGEVALWAEQADPVNLDILLWPRSCAAAEVLWAGNTDTNNRVVIPRDTLPRLNNFRFHLLHHKVNAEPLQPMWCVRNPGRCNA